jgi:hypothetical protein
MLTVRAAMQAGTTDQSRVLGSGTTYERLGINCSVFRKTEARRMSGAVMIGKGMIREALRGCSCAASLKAARSFKRQGDKEG